MTETKLDPKTEKKLLAAQRTELVEHHIYARMANVVRGDKNKKILREIADDELRHHHLCTYHSCQGVKPDRFKIWFYYLISRLFGITFGLKLMEKAENKAHDIYLELEGIIPGVENIALDEERHANELLNLIDDERLEYSSDVVRGLSVALVELTGSLAGFTLALQSHDLILTAGIIIGITISFTITGTEYLATKSGTGVKNPVKSAAYAGLANVLTIFLILVPFSLFSNIYAALGCMIGMDIILLFIISFYLSVSRDTPLIKMFVETMVITLGIAALAFGIGFLAREFLHIHV